MDLNKKKDYNNKNNMGEVFYEKGFIPGRLISASKSFYRSKFPDNEVYFNANIFVLGEGKIWYGDIDVTIDIKILKEIASSIGKDLFILWEMDGRFGNEDMSDSEIISRSVCKISK
jgi:hypothetical protein